MRKDQFQGSKGVYYYMVLTHRQYKTIDFQPSQMYWDIVRNGTPVWVKKDTMVKVLRPNYSNHVAFPVFTETDPRDTDYVQIIPHSRMGRNAVKATGPPVPQERTTYDPRKFDPAEEETKSESSDEEEAPRGGNRFEHLPESNGN
jgi:hypothetical protein